MKNLDPGPLSASDAQSATAGISRELEAARRLQEISTRLIGQNDEASLYLEILDAALVIMGADAASVQRLDMDTGKLELLGSRGFHPEAAAFWQWVAANDGSACAEALRTGRRIIAEDVEAAPFEVGRSDMESYRRSGLRAVQSTPLQSRLGQPLGMISTLWRRPHRPAEHELRLLDVLARQAAELIERVQSEEASQRESAAARAAEAHSRLLADELNHRVKNTLATVQSVAIQTLKSATSLETFGQDFLARLDALAQTHDLLMRSGWQGVDLREMLERELKPYGRPSGPRLALRGDAVCLHAQAALALGMALHELATNAAKYGALSTPGGRLDIAWRREPDLLSLEWTESDGPAVQPPSHRGFGSRLIEHGLAYELQAEVRLDFRPRGVTCLFRIPSTAFADDALG